MDYDVVAVHDWPVDRSTVRTPEEAVGLPTGTWTFVEGYLVTGPGHRTRLCSEAVGDEPSQCSETAPSAARGSQPARRTTAVHKGLMRAWVDDVTGSRRLELLTLEVTDTYDPYTAGDDDLRAPLGDTSPRDRRGRHDHGVRCRHRLRAAAVAGARQHL